MRLRLRKFNRRLAAIALAGVALRLFYVFVLSRHVKGIGDWYFFHWQANLLAEGRGYIDPFELVFHGRTVPSAGHPPLFPTYLSIFSLLGAKSYLAHRAAGCLLGAATIVLLGLLGRRVAGERAGLLAAGVGAVHPLLVAADGALMSEALYGALIALTLLLAYRLYDRDDTVSAAMLGGAVALAAMTRTEALLLLVVLVLPLALRRGRRRIGHFGVAVLACTLVLAPWTIRNWSAFNRPVLISTNDGTVLAGANCPLTYHGRDIGYWRIECVSKKRPGLNEAEQSARWRRAGLSYASHHASDLPGVLAVRVLRAWDLYQPRRQVLSAEGRWIRAEQAGVAFYFLLLPFAAYGLAVLRRRNAPVWILLSTAVLVTVTCLLGYGLPRFRHPADIAIVVLAGVAVSDLLARRAAVRAAREPAPDSRDAALAGEL